MKYSLTCALTLLTLSASTLADPETPSAQNHVAATAGEALPSARAPAPALFRCSPVSEAARRVLRPLPLISIPGAGLVEEAADAALPCPSGQAPQPQARFANKGRLPTPSRKGGIETPAPQAAVTASYFYSSAYQFFDTDGSVASFTQPAPFLDSADFHSLGEIAAQSSDGRQIVEIGWTVDRAVNGGSSAPHLFAFHWVDGVPACYNGCGYVQVSATRFPGMRLKQAGAPQQYAIQYFQGNWWIGYQAEWIGYFPGSLWNNTYIRAGLNQWFGEVAASSGAACTDMGNGLFGSSSGSASISNIFFINGPYASPSPIITHPNFYNGTIVGSSMSYGGPGAC